MRVRSKRHAGGEKKKGTESKRRLSVGVGVRAGESEEIQGNRYCHSYKALVSLAESGSESKLSNYERYNQSGALEQTSKKKLNFSSYHLHESKSQFPVKSKRIPTKRAKYTKSI